MTEREAFERWALRKHFDDMAMTEGFYDNPTLELAWQAFMAAIPVRTWCARCEREMLQIKKEAG